MLIASVRVSTEAASARQTQPSHPPEKAAKGNLRRLKGTEHGCAALRMTVVSQRRLRMATLRVPFSRPARRYKVTRTQNPFFGSFWFRLRCPTFLHSTKTPLVRYFSSFASSLHSRTTLHTVKERQAVTMAANSTISSGSSSSGSSSSGGVWSDQEDDQRPEKVQLQAQEQINAKTPRPTHGEKRAFEAPSGYEPASFSSDVLSTFSADRFGKKARKELWCIKIPDGISPAQLDGLSIALPKDGQSNARLAQLQVERAGKGDGMKAFKQHYSLRSRRAHEGGPRSGQNSAMSQLIAMAGGKAVLSQETAADGEGGNEEMEALQVMLPDPDREGGYTLAPIAIKQHMQLLLDAPVKADMTVNTSDRSRVADELSASGRAAGASAGTKGTRKQPWSKLKGFFGPAGSLSADGGPEVKSQKNKDDPDDESPQNAKKRKKDGKSKAGDDSLSNPSPSKKEKRDKKEKKANKKERS